MSPQVLGRYQLLREIASGGMATVYAARAGGAGGFQKLVAVKRMLPHMTSEQRFKDMFLDEARLTANIRSPYAVATLDLGEAEDGSLFLVMDLVIGSSLAEILRGCITQGRVLPIPAVVEIVQQAARGLHDAHEATSPLGEPLHIVHRDVSPQNILVGIDGASRITDFGVAHALERLTKTKGRNIKGKIAYCSPEQARGDALDARSDVFALGIVLWEALTQRRLFKGKSMSETITALLSGEIPDPRTIRPEIPERLAAVVHTALQRNPAHRYQSALEFAEDLSRAVEEHVRTEELRDLVKLIAGDSIAELVSDIRAAIETSSTDAGRTWDDAPTEIDRSQHTTRGRSASQAETLKQLKETGQFLALPPSEAMLAASSPSGVTPAAANFSTSFEGPSPVIAPGPSDGFAMPPQEATRSGRNWGLIVFLGCFGLAILTTPLVYMMLSNPAPEPIAPGVDSTGAFAGGTPISPAPPTPSTLAPIHPAPPLGQAAPEPSESARFGLAFFPHLWRGVGSAGGPHNAAELSPSCTGFVTESPQHVVVLDDDFPRLRIFAHSESNTSLVIRGPGGVVCNDDGEGIHPLVDRDFVAGRYEIFVAADSALQKPEYTLGITEFEEFSPRSLAPEMPDRPGLEPLRSPMGARRHRANHRGGHRSERTSLREPPWEGSSSMMSLSDPWVSSDGQTGAAEDEVQPRAPILR